MKPATKTLLLLLLTVSLALSAFNAVPARAGYVVALPLLIAVLENGNVPSNGMKTDLPNASAVTSRQVTGKDCDDEI